MDRLSIEELEERLKEVSELSEYKKAEFIRDFGEENLPSTYWGVSMGNYLTGEEPEIVTAQKKIHRYMMKLSEINNEIETLKRKEDLKAIKKKLDRYMKRLGVSTEELVQMYDPNPFYPNSYEEDNEDFCDYD